MQQIKPAQSANQKTREGDRPKVVTRTEVATQAGIS